MVLLSSFQGSGALSTYQFKLCHAHGFNLHHSHFKSCLLIEMNGNAINWFQPHKKMFAIVKFVICLILKIALYYSTFKII